VLRKRVVRNPKKEIIAFAITVVVIIAVFFAVLNYFISLQHPPTSAAELTVGPLQFSLVMPQTQYVEGAPIPLKLSVKNTGNRDVTLQFDEDIEYDFVVQKDLNLIFSSVPLDIWKYSSTHPSPIRPHTRVLKPQASLTYKTNWEQIDSNGEPVSPGRYLITGVVNLRGERQTLQIRGNTE